MGNCLMMKSAEGHLAGYIQSAGETIRCKLLANSQAHSAQVTLLFEDGRTQTLETTLDGTERKSRAEGGRLTGAYAVAGNRLLCATDESARLAGLGKLAGSARIQKPVKTVKTERTDQTGREEKQAKESAQPVFQPFCFPQRRWPPPPCCPKASYEQGKWIIPDE